VRVAKSRDLYDLALLVLNEMSSRPLSSHGEEILARLIGEIAWRVQWGQRRTIADRLSGVLCDEMTPDQIKKLTRKVFRNKWVERFSYAAASKKNACQNVRIEGLERLHEAVRLGKGVILWESPFGKRLLGKVALMERGFILCQVHDQGHGGSRSWLGQRVIRKIHRTAEARVFPEIIDIQDDSFAYLRSLINRLRQNAIICISALGGKGHKFVSLEFLGYSQRFATGTVSLARMTGASLIPIFCIKQDDGTNRLIIENPIYIKKNGDSDQAAVDGVAEYAGLLESYIRKHPDHWYRWDRAAQ